MIPAFPRSVFGELLAQAGERKVSLLLGARQVGKTTLLGQLHGELCLKRGAPGLLLDLDVFSNFEKVSTFERLSNLLNANGFGGKRRFYLFLDEFQRYGGMTMVLKNAFDHLGNLKIYASGSSALKIKDEVQESLAGRKKTNVIRPLDFREFLEFKQRTGALNQLKNTRKLKGAALEKTLPELAGLLKEFMIFGGYPAVVLAEGEKAKRDALEGIFDLYLRKDLVEYLNVKKILNVKRLVEFLAVNHGQKVKYEEAAAACGLTQIEVKNYMEVLRESHLVSVMRPFFTNKNKELVKIPKVYFEDNGVRNYFINNFNPLALRRDAGFLFEGFAVGELLKGGTPDDGIRFWQDKNRREVDIVLGAGGGTETAIELKYKNAPSKDDETGLRAFLTSHPEAKKAFLVNTGTRKTSGKIRYELPYGIQTLCGKK
ncbi:ATP-binding protein [Candidatus Micrarchaeota archaeon]|nr:ATP-binding protein [Candidatus Micrarchaeota archaeon]